MGLPHEEAHLELTVPGSPAGLRDATEAFDRFSDAHRVPDAVRRSIQIVLDELLSNTIRCGSNGREVTIGLGFRLREKALEVVITDDAAPFNPLEAPTPDTTSSLDERAVGGLGLMLVKELVDDITYDCEGGRNRVMLDKRLDA